MSGSPSMSEHRSGFVAHKSVHKDIAKSQEKLHLEEANPAPDDNLARHEKICGSLIRIVGYKPHGVQKKLKCVVTGFIVASGDTFCNIIALWVMVLNDSKSSKWLFEVIFPDGTTVDIERPVQGLGLEGKTLSLTLQTSTKFSPVQLSAQEVSVNDTVFSMGFGLDVDTHKTTPRVIASYRSRGLVTHTRAGGFGHDCAPRGEIYCGHPIFNKQDQLVGMTYKDRGIGIALGISSLTKLIAQFHDGMNGKSLSEILRCIMDNAESSKEEERWSHGKKK